MKILVTGANGQLGSEIRKISGVQQDHEFVFIDIADIDLTDSPAVKIFLETQKPDIIINCAAYTAVDRAEQEPQAAFKLNAELPGILATFCKKNESSLVHISTDYVFSGRNYIPYKENDPAAPEGTYASSKLEGEKNILTYNPDGYIIRTSWLYSEFGNNFVKTIYNKAKTSSQLKVVCDQIGTPTYAGDLADTVLRLINSQVKPTGIEILHYSNEGVISWFDFAYAIKEIGKIDSCELLPIPTSAWPTPARRPFYSVLDKTKIKEKYGIKIPYWKESLEKCIEIIRNY